MNNNDVINDLNGILADTPAVTSSNDNVQNQTNDVVANLADLLNLMPSATSRIDVAKRINSVGSEIEMAIRTLEDDIKSFTNSNIVVSPELAQAKEALLNNLKESNDNIKNYTDEMEALNETNKILRDTIKKYNEMSASISVAASGVTNTKYNSELISENNFINNKIESLNNNVDVNEKTIEENKEKIVLEENNIIDINNKVREVESKIDEENKIKMSEQEENVLKGNTVLVALKYNNEYNKLDPKEQLQKLVVDYSNGKINDEQLKNSLGNLKTSLVNIGIANANLPAIGITREDLNNQIASLRAENASNLLTPEKMKENENILKTYELNVTALDLQEKCASNDIVGRIDLVINKLDKTESKVLPIGIPLPINEARVNESEVLQTPETLATTMPIVDDNKIEENENEEVIVPIIQNSNDIEIKNKKEAPIDLKSKAKAFWEKYKKPIGLALLTGAVLLGLHSCSELDKGKTDEDRPITKHEHVINPNGSQSNSENAPTRPSNNNLNNSDNTNVIPDTPQQDIPQEPLPNLPVEPLPDEEPIPLPVGPLPNEEPKPVPVDPEVPIVNPTEDDYVLRNETTIDSNGNVTGQKESISIEIDGQPNIHLTTEGNIITEDGNIIDNIDVSQTKDGDTVVDKEDASTALKEAYDNYQNTVDIKYNDISGTSSTGNEQTADMVSSEEQQNLNDAAYKMFEDMGISFDDTNDAPTMGGR